MEVLQLLESSALFFAIAACALGLVVGSFLNVVIHRLPVMMNNNWSRECREHMGDSSAEPLLQEPFNLLTPASRCPQCGHRITALENIPVISYLLLRGRCSGCGTGIPLRYPAVEIGTAVLSVATALHFGYSVQTLAALAFTWALVPLFLIDFDTQILPDTITLPLLCMGGAAAQPVQCLRRQPDQHHRSGRRLSVALVCLPPVQAWASGTSSCWAQSAPGPAGRHCRSSSCFPPLSGP